MRALSILLLLTVVLVVPVVLLTSISAVAAQTTPLCPPQALLSIARAGAACANLDAGNACYGSGTVTSTTQEGSASPGLVQLGDRVPLLELESVAVRPTGDDTVSMATLTIHSLSGGSGVATMLLIEDAEAQNQVFNYAEQVVKAIGSLNLREAPADDAPILATLAINSGVVANGRYEDWVRVIVPTTGQAAWVNASLLSGDIVSLPRVDPLQLPKQPFADVYLTIGDGLACGGMLPAGVLLQSSSTNLNDAVHLVIAGSGTASLEANLRLAGTVFIALNPEGWSFFALDGVFGIESGDVVKYVPAGTRTHMSWWLGQSVPYDPAQIAALPVNNLPRRFQIVPPQPQDVIDAQIAVLNAPLPTAVPTAEPTPSNACRRAIGRNADLMSGPGEDYEALGEIEAGTPIRPQLAATDPQGGVWWQLPDSAWVARADVVERGDCSAQAVPVTGRIEAPPYNTYSLERCQSSNGPVRAGQYVTIEFLPPAWDNLGEARAAIRTDPGHFEINAENYRANASEPFRLGENVHPLEDRYLRRFTLNWRAEPGTFRITGDWLHYEPSCNLTVAVE